MPVENTSTSCITKSAFIELGTENAPKLSYKLPQTAGFEANVPILLSIDSGDYLPEHGIGIIDAMEDTYYTTISSDENVIKANLSNAYVARSASGEIISEEAAVAYTQGMVTLAKAANTNLGATSNNPDAKISNYNLDDFAKLAKEGYPVENIDFAGKKSVQFVPDPGAVTPEFYIVEHYAVQSYLGNYGAGETIKTFSLLPGERSTISIKTYKQTVQNQTKTQNVLDSFTDESARELEESVETEGTDKTIRDKTKALDLGFKSSVTVPISEGLSLSAGSSTDYKATNRNAREVSLKKLNKSVEKQVQKSIVNRKIEVNTENAISETDSEETNITRILENINKSRVLNFVFRQLNQELITVTYLEDVTFVFRNGYEEFTRKCKLPELYGFLEKLLDPSMVLNTYKEIINHLYNVQDYSGTIKNFVKKVTEEYTDIFASPPAVTDRFIFLKDPDLEMTVPDTADFTEDNQDIKVNGIITDITRRVLPTPALIVDALLGHGEALDCFNLKLQDAAVLATHLENSEKEQAIAIIDEFETAADKAANYKKVFGPCCEVAQVGCNCNNGGV